MNSVGTMTTLSFLQSTPKAKFEEITKSTKPRTTNQWSSNTIDLIIVLIQVFLSEAPRGIVVPTLFPYIRATKTANPELVASLAVSAFSVGRLLSSYPLGLLADNTGSSRLSLMIGTIIVIIFNTIFAFAGLLGPSVSPSVIVISRFLVGFGSGTLGVARAFMARISTPEERLKYVMYNTLLQYIGFSISPILAEIVAAVFPKGLSPVVQFGLLPGMTTTGLSIIMLGLLFQMRAKDPSTEEIPALQVNGNEFPDDSKPAYASLDRGRKKSESHNSQEKNEKAAVVNMSLESQSTMYRERKLFACFMLYLLLNFSLRGILGVLETYGGNLFQQIKSPGKAASADIVRQSGEFFVYMGIVGVGVLLVLPRVAKRFTPYWTLLFGIWCITLGTILFLPFLYKSDIAYFSFAVVLIWSIGSPITQTLTISTYSQMMGSKPQGSAMGWLTTAGSLGRIIFPVIAGASFDASAYINFITSILSTVAVVGFRILFGLEN